MISFRNVLTLKKRRSQMRVHHFTQVQPVPFLRSHAVYQFCVPVLSSPACDGERTTPYAIPPSFSSRGATAYSRPLALVANASDIAQGGGKKKRRHVRPTAVSDV